MRILLKFNIRWCLSLCTVGNLFVYLVQFQYIRPFLGQVLIGTKVRTPDLYSCQQVCLMSLSSVYVKMFLNSFNNNNLTAQCTDQIIYS